MGCRLLARCTHRHFFHVVANILKLLIFQGGDLAIITSGMSDREFDRVSFPALECGRYTCASGQLGSAAWLGVALDEVDGAAGRKLTL